MATIKTKFRSSSVEGREGTLYFQIIHGRVARQINTGYRLFPSEWDGRMSEIILPVSGDARRSLLLALKERMEKDIRRLESIIAGLERSGGTYPAGRVVELFHNPPPEDSHNFMAFGKRLVEELERVGKKRTAERYTTVLNSFTRFRGRDGDIPLEDIGSTLMLEYEAWLKDKGICPNSTCSEAVIPCQHPAGMERDNYLLSVGERIRRDKIRLEKAIRTLSQSGPFTADDIVIRFHDSGQEPSFNDYIRQQIVRLKRLGKIRTSETYTAALKSFSSFMKGSDILFGELSSDLLMEYEAYLKNRGNSPNTISFYMRILKAVYNRAVENGLTGQRNLFKSVYTGVEKTLKRAIHLNDIRRIKRLDLSLKPHLDFARDMFLFCFYTRGMSFVDMAYLKKGDIANGILTYRRKKTGQQLFIRWEKCMQEIIKLFCLSVQDFKVVH